jgi:resuscitation-promoting factor RpfA
MKRPPHYRQWLCIYKYENAGYGWSANTGNGYYGGLQMDIEFQKDYGLALYRRKGTADNWTPLEQMWVAERAWKTRGFWPWPNTARYCGLI